MLNEDRYKPSSIPNSYYMGKEKFKLYRNDGSGYRQEPLQSVASYRPVGHLTRKLKSGGMYQTFKALAEFYNKYEHLIRPALATGAKVL